MYVRDAKNRDEVWLLDHIEAMGLDATAFRSRDYVIAVDETSDTRTGFGRIRIHRPESGDTCELTSIGVLDGWRRQGVGAHVVERLLQHAADQEFETVYALAPLPDYLAQFGFDPVDPDRLPEPLGARLEEKRERHGESETRIIPMAIPVDEFVMPDRLRERFKTAAEREDSEAEERPEDFGIDPDEATYKYDTGR